VSFHIFARMFLEVRCVDLDDANIDQYAMIEEALLDELGTVDGVPDAITELGKLRHVASPQATPTEQAAVNEAIVAANGILTAENLGFEFDAVNNPIWVDLGDNVHQTITGGRSTLNGNPWIVTKNLDYKDSGGDDRNASFSGNVRLVIRYQTPEV